MKAKDQVKRAALNKAVDYLLEDPEHNAAKLLDAIDKILPRSVMGSQRDFIRTQLSEGTAGYGIIKQVMNLNPDMRDRFVHTAVVDATLLAWQKQEEMRISENCNIPWALLMDPTSACNLHCVGCWAADYGNQLNLSYEDLDSIVCQANELGTHFFLFTGGEPLVRKHDIIKLCEAHPDSLFSAFTNATLIDEQFCQDMVRVANFVPAISIEGNEQTTDARRGQGTFSKISNALELLRQYKLPFGASCCYTSQNAETIGSEAYVDWLAEQGCLFEWIFTYMPIGKSAPVDLIATAKQREDMYHFVREVRAKKPIFLMDFWNDGEYVGGCIAGGRRYLHINAAGDIEPCAFAHYSDSNIHDTKLLDALKKPLFAGYRDAQPFNDNLLRPCPMLDNAGALAQLVEAVGAKSTDYSAQESADELCAKCAPAAEKWAPVAHRLWTDEQSNMYEKRITINQGMADSDVDKFERLGRPGRTAADPQEVNLDTADDSYESLAEWRAEKYDQLMTAEK
ncbi:radical SAM protein [Olegusella massiliensis]|uniref:radical SAM protein n=1 Tax=Olegusella massiliensis TaxID=1776381 RepID=UPI0040558B78